MSTSGQKTFNLYTKQIISLALKRARFKDIDDKTALLSDANDLLMAMVLSWQAKGVNLWKRVVDAPITLTAGVASYSLSTDCLEVESLFFRDNVSGADLPVASRLTIEEYDKLPAKLVQGTPVIWTLDMQRSAPILYLQPVPDATFVATKTLYHTKIVRLEDFMYQSDNGDFPVKWLNALILGLAHKVAPMNTDTYAGGQQLVVSSTFIKQLKDEADEAFESAKLDDNEQGAIQFGVDFCSGNYAPHL